MRKLYLDNIRWMTVVIVVFYHVFYMYNAEGVLGGAGRITSLNVQYYDAFNYIVYPWIMPVLFIVSGICSRHYLDGHTGREFIRSRTTRLLVPSTIGLFAFQFIQGYVSMALSGAFDTMQGVPGPVKYLIMALSGTGVLWYAQLLWVFSLVLLLIRRIDKDRLYNAAGKTSVPVLILLAVPVWLAAQILNMPVVVVYRFGLYGMMFLIGYFVLAHDEVIERLKKAALPLLAAAVVLGIVFCIRYFGDNYADAPINRSILFTTYGWIACLAIIAVMARYGDRQSAFSAWMSSHSFGLYVFHYLGISTVALLAVRTAALPAPAVYLLSTIAGFAAGYLLYEIISRIPFFRWAVLGIRPKNK